MHERRKYIIIKLSDAKNSTYSDHTHDESKVRGVSPKNFSRPPPLDPPLS